MTASKHIYRPSAIERFYNFTDVHEGGCWLWKSTTTPNGYPTFWVDRKHVLAHRFIFEYTYGPIPDKMTLDHLCRVRACVNPEHTAIVTHGENVLRGISPSARCARATHCIHGHPWDESNTKYVIENGHKQRRCKACATISWKRKQVNKKQAALAWQEER